MIDTVTVKFPVSPTPKQLQEWVGHHLIPPYKSALPKYFQNVVMKNGAPIKFTYYPLNPRYPKPHLRIEASLPMVLFGNNIRMVVEQSQIEEAISQVNGYLSGLSWVPKVDFGDGTLFRVDATYNHPVGERVQDYITAISYLTYPHRETRPWMDGGVQFYSKATTTTFYDKWKVNPTPLAWGLLRQESSMRDPANIAYRIGKDNPTLRDITGDWLADILCGDLEKLHLNDAIICDRDLSLEILLKKYDVNKATRLYGYLIAKQSMTRKQFMALGAIERTLENWDKALHEAGLALAMTEKVSLPPLTLNVQAQKISGST